MAEALTDRDRNALVARLRESRVAAGWADEVQHSGADTIEDLIAAAESVAHGSAQGGQARAVARVAREVFLAYAQDQMDAGTSLAAPTVLRQRAAAAPRPTEHQARLGRGREARLRRRRRRAEAAHGDTLEGVDGLLAALALMGEEVAERPLFRLARQHVARGFRLPPEVEALVHAQARDDEPAAVGASELDGIRVALLRYAVAGLRRTARNVAYALIARWERDARFRDADRQTVESLLWEARNDKV